MHFRDDMISELVDLLDEAIMIYYESKQQGDKTIYYFDTLTDVLSCFNNNKLLEIDDKEINVAFNSIINEIKSKHFYFEERRRALLLLEIKGLKHLNYPLDIITPDTIGVLAGSLVDALTDGKEKVTVIDPNYGLGNLALIVNEVVGKPLNWFGIENHERFANYLKEKNAFLSNELSFLFGDALIQPYPLFDLVVSDLAIYNYENENYRSNLSSQGITYFPYLLIERLLNHGTINSKYLLLINNDFFKQFGSDKFQKALEGKGQIVALIMLPINFFQGHHKGKSFIVINKMVEKRETTLFMLPNLENSEAILATMKEIKTFLRSL